MSNILLKQKDYEELSQSIFDLNLKVIERDKEIERLHSIIKEVREYCKNKIQEQKDMKDFSKYYLEGYDKVISVTHSTHSGILLETIKSTTIKRYESILEILDKGE